MVIFLWHFKYDWLKLSVWCLEIPVTDRAETALPEFVVHVDINLWGLLAESRLEVDKVLKCRLEEGQFIHGRFVGALTHWWFWYFGLVFRLGLFHMSWDVLMMNYICLSWKIERFFCKIVVKCFPERVNRLPKVIIKHICRFLVIIFNKYLFIRK